MFRISDGRLINVAPFGRGQRGSSVVDPGNVLALDIAVRQSPVNDRRRWNRNTAAE